jgi:hypothetical protein
VSAPALRVGDYLKPGSGWITINYYNYFYIHKGIYMTIRSRFMVCGLSRSVESFHCVWSSFGVF